MSKSADGKQPGVSSFFFTFAGCVVIFSLLLAPAYLRIYKLRNVKASLQEVKTALERQVDLNRKSASEMSNNADYLASVVSRELGMVRADEENLELPGPPSVFKYPQTPAWRDPAAQYVRYLAPLAYDLQVRYTALFMAFVFFAGAAVCSNGARPVQAKPVVTGRTEEKPLESNSIEPSLPEGL